MLESLVQKKFIKKIKERMPGAIVIKNDPNYLQGFPDLLILYGRNWAAVETKQRFNSRKRPNQVYYIELLGEMSYASFVNAETIERVVDEIQQTFSRA